MTEPDLDLGAVVGVYRRSPLKALQYWLTALATFGLGGACVWAIYEMKPKSTGLPWLFVLICAAGGLATLYEWWVENDLLLELCERGFRLRRGGHTQAARWQDVRSWSTWKRNGEPMWFTLQLASGGSVRLKKSLERFDQLGEILRETLRPG